MGHRQGWIEEQGGPQLPGMHSELYYPVPAPWGGEIGFRAGAIVFFVVSVAALMFVARAAWSAEREVAA